VSKTAAKESHLAHWWHWIFRHQGESLTLTVSLLTGLGTFALALNANRQSVINKRQLTLDRVRYNRDFLGAIYERGMEAFSETVEALEVWQNGITNMASTATSFNPASVSAKQIDISRQRAFDFGKEMKLYPNSKIRPHYDRFLSLVNEIMDEFDSLYDPANQHQGPSFLDQVIIKTRSILDSIKQTNAEFESVVISELNSTD
jgi:hypothetical protein